MAGPLPSTFVIKLDEYVTVSPGNAATPAWQTPSNSATASFLTPGLKYPSAAALAAATTPFSPAAAVLPGVAASPELADIRNLNQFVSSNAPINYKDNPLNDFANYTYHVKFSLIDYDRAFKVKATDNLSALNQIVIAESGATAGFNIAKFSIHNTVSPDFKTQNQNIMTWKMTITEPYGLTLSDYIIAAGRELNIRNTDRFPFFIELWFTGYDEAGDIVQPNITRKIWRVVMLDMSLSGSHIGTTYELHGVADNNLGSANQFAMTAATIQIDDIKTVEVAIAKLTESLNKTSKDAENKNKGSNTYKIEIPDEMMKWNIVPPNSDKDVSRLGSFFSEKSSKNGNSIPINRGQDVGNYIMYMLGKCKEADSFIRGINGIGSTSSLENNGLGRVVQIYTEVEFGNYNIMTNDYDKIITFRLVPYYTTRIVSDPNQAKKMGQIGIQKDKISFLSQNNLLKKKYDYMYTGLNTEVLKFDIQVNKFWAIALSPNLNSSDYSQWSVGAILSSDTIGFRGNRGYGEVYKAADEVMAQFKALSDQRDKLSDRGRAVLDKILKDSGAGSVLDSYAKLASTAGKLSPNELASALKGITSDMQKITKLDILTTPAIPRFDGNEGDIIKAIAGSSANLLSSGLAPLGTAATNLLASNPANDYRGGKYLEDIKDIVESDDPLKVAFFTDNEPRIQNGTTGGSVSKNQASAVAAGGTSPSGAGLFGQILSNLYDSGGQMANIDLEIRGDPWWIGMTNIEENEYARSRLSNTETTENNEFATFLNGENLFMLRFRTGSNYSEETGLMTFNSTSDYFNGLYFVREVENTFENGKFTQTLKASKELFSQQFDKVMSPKDVEIHRLNKQDAALAAGGAAGKSLATQGQEGSTAGKTLRNAGIVNSALNPFNR
jgi:hypothetical protein